MRDGHLHVRTHANSRGKGTGAGSSVRAAAYQTGTALTHEGVRLCSVSLEHRKGLNKGIVSDALRQELNEPILFTAPLMEMDRLQQKEISPQMRDLFEAHGITLSERLTFYPSQDGVTIRDRGPPPKTAGDPDRKRRADPGTRQTYRLRMEEGQILVTKRNGVLLSDKARAEKGDKRRYWIIRDGDTTYQVREFVKQTTNPETGKREVIQKGLDIYGDKTFSYAKRTDVRESWLEVPENAPNHIQEIAARGTDITQPDLQAFMNQVEAADPSRDGRPARSFELGFLRDLTHEQNKEALQRFTQEHFTSKGLAVLVSIHEIQAGDGKPNVHVHLLVPARKWDTQGNLTVREDQLNSEITLKQWRRSWSQQLNRQLAEAGVEDIRTDPRSYQERGLNKEAGEHLGPQQWAIEERGEETYYGELNREVKKDNKIRQMRDHLMPRTESKQRLQSTGQQERDLRDVSRNLIDDNTESSGGILGRIKTGFASAMRSRAVQGSIAFVSLMLRSNPEKDEELLRNRTSGSQQYDPYVNLHSTAKEQKERENDHER